jgi:hypothetical protein
VKTLIKILLGVSLFYCGSGLLAQETTYKPFIVASAGEAGLTEKTTEVLAALESAGFEIAGQYSPMPDTNIIVVTNDELKRIASLTASGGYAAAQRISVSEAVDNVEVAFVNPLYMQHAYRLGGSMQGTYDQLSETLGNTRSCGAGNKKMTAKKLKKYNYMMGMQKFDDPSELGEFPSHEAAVAAVESGLAKEEDGLTMIYRIDIPGREQTVFGVGMKSTGEADEDIDEAYQMSVVDFEGCRKHAYLPYEVLVSGNTVEALHMRFRMAVHFPNLSMMGKHGFTKLMPVPGAIEDALEDMVGAQ